MNPARVRANSKKLSAGAAMKWPGVNSQMAKPQMMAKLPAIIPASRGGKCQVKCQFAGQQCWLSRVNNP